MKKVLILSLILLSHQLQATPTASQPKIGYTNMEYIIRFMPEIKQVESNYSSYSKQLVQKLDTEEKKLIQKAQAFQKGYDTMTEAVKTQKQTEIQQLQESLRQAQIESQEKLALKRSNLLQPIYEKVQKAIQKVAQANGYSHVLNSDVGGMPILLYADEEYDITELVLKQLGIDPATQEKKGKQKQAGKKKTKSDKK